MLFENNNYSTLISPQNFNESSTEQCSLEYLNDREIKRRIVPLTFLSVIMVLGIPGNLVIMYIYSMKLQRKTIHRIFVVAIAVTDFLICTVTIPFEIGQMSHEYTFYAEWLCKLGRTLNSAFTTASAFLLFALSANRYRRICKPFGSQLRKSQAFKCIVLIASISAVLSLPECKFSGLKLADIGNNQTSSDCTSTGHPVTHKVILTAIYILCMISLLVMCLLIGRKLLKHDTFRNQFRPSAMSMLSKSSSPRSPQSTFKNGTGISDLGNSASNNQNNYSKDYKKVDSPVNVSKTALVVSICFLIGFTPHLTIKLIEAITKGRIMPPCHLASILLPTLSRTHYINNVANFLIYVCMDKSFRRYCKSIIKKPFSVLLNNIKST